MRQRCVPESTAEDDVLPPDSGDAPRNTVPSLPSPLTCDRQHAARSKLQWRFSFNIQNVRPGGTGCAFFDKHASLTISAEPVGRGAALQLWFLAGEQSGLTRIAATESVSLCERIKS